MVSRASLVAELFEAGDAGAFDRFSALLAESVVVHAPFGLATLGIEAECQSWRNAKAAIPDLRHELQVVVCQGPFESARYVVTGTLRGEYGGFRADAAPFRVDQAVFARLEDGQIVELWEIVDTEALVNQLRAETRT